MRTGKTRAARAGLLAAAALLSFASLPARAQSVAAELIPQGIELEDYGESAPGPWTVFVRGGPVSPLGGGFFSDGLQSGWAIQAGVQARFYEVATAAGPWSLFGEVGGSYASNRRDGTPGLTTGTFYAPPDTHIHRGAFFETNIHEIQRPSFEAALGTRYYPLALNAPGRCAVQFNGRLGFRAGAALFTRSEMSTASLHELTEEHASSGHNGGHPHDAATYQINNDFSDSAALFGLFASLGVGLTCPDVRLGRVRMGEWTVGLEVEFGHDFFNSGAFEPSHSGLGTITPMATLSLGF